MMLRIAFKEWAAICRALALGRQAIILRKGGIAESGGTFEPEHNRFWLYPTYVHQQQGGLKPDAIDRIRAAEAERPPAGVLRLSHIAEVKAIYHVQQLFGVLLLEDFHCWSEETVRQRFAYRAPGLYVLAVRVYAVPDPHELPEQEGYAGCRTWVDLGRDLPTDNAVAVISDNQFDDLLLSLSRRLNPTATA
jgi:hypothetical protein